nr:putative ribonuclease H-like domain-containing protein [Tanacetum cinerariifolium]
LISSRKLNFIEEYSVSSKAFRVFNSRTRIVQETLHINFIENQPNFARSGPRWLFNIDTLTQSMNYQPVIIGNQPNPSAGVQEQFDVEKARKESAQQYMLFPVWSSGSTNAHNTNDDAAFGSKEPEFEGRKPESEVHVSPSSKFKDFSGNSINEVNAADSPVLAVGQNLTNITNTFSVACPSNTTVNITYSDEEEDVGVEADFDNLETTIIVSPIPTTRVHKDHPITQIIGDLSLATQIRSITRVAKDHGGLSQINNDEFHTYLCKAFQKLMKDKFQISSMGELTFFLGLQVKQKQDGIFIRQDKYVAEILRKFGLTDGKSASTPIDTKKPLLKDPDGEDVDVHTYRSMIGSLMYLTSSRLDIMFAQYKKQTVMATSSTKAAYVAAANINPNELDLWKMRIEQYFPMTDYSLWEVILNGDSLVPTSLPTEWGTHTLIWRNKTDLEEQILDGLFNSLKIYEAKRTGWNLGENGPTSMGFDMSNVECYNYHRKGHFARECRSPKDTIRNVAAEPQRRNAEEEPTNYAPWHLPLQVLIVLTMSSMFDCDEMFTSETDESLPASPIHDRYHSEDRYHAIPPPYTGTFMPPIPDLVFHDAPNVNETVHTAFNVKLSPTKPDKDLSHTHRPSAPIIKNCVSNSEDDSKAEIPQNAPSFIQPTEQVKTPRSSVKTIETSIPAANHKTTILKPKSNSNRRNRKACFVYKSLTYLIKYLLTKSKLVPITPARPVTASVPKPHVTRPRQAKTIVTKPHSPPRRNINRSSSPKASNFLSKVTTKAHMVNDVKRNWVWKPKCPILDHVSYSRCSRHMTRNMSYLYDFEELNGGYVAFGGNPKGGKISGKGKIRTGKLDFDDVYFVKELKFNLFSVSQICDKKTNILFTDTKCLVLSPEFKLPDENQVLLRVPRENNMYNVDLKNIVPSGDLTCLFTKEILDESNLWHKRLGHINFKTMNKLAKGNVVRGLPLKVFENNHTCVACKKGKQHRAFCKTKPFSSVSQPLQRLHMDLFGPTLVKILNKKSYCLVVTDDYSRFTWVFFLATKDETSPILKTFITSIENQLSLNVKIIKSNNGTEFKNNYLNQFFEMKGIKREFSIPRTHQQNGIAKRKNRTLIKDARTMIAGSLLLIPFWAEAVNTACYVQNRVLVTKPQNKTPYELSLGKTPSIGFMRPFGCPVTILNTLDPLGKFDRKADEGFLVRYFVSSKAFKVLVLYGCLILILLQRLRIINQSMQNTNDDTEIGGKKPEFEGRKLESEVHVSPSSKFEDFSNNNINEVNATDSPVPAVGQISTNSTNTFSAAEDITYSNDEEDVGAEADFTNLETTITVSPIPTTRVHKDHLVTQIIGDLSLVTQTRSMDEGIDYEEVFTPVARIEAIRLFLAYASVKGFMVYQMDVKSAFLYGNIEKEIYVDDIIFGSTNKDLCKAFVKLIKDKFQMSSMGELTFFLGLQVKQKPYGIFISQDKYVVEILRKFGMTDGKSASTLIDTENPLLKDPYGEDVDVHTYRSMIGSLMYLTLSRPDIMFAVYAYAHFQVTPKDLHLHAVKRIFRYLKSKPHLGLWYPKDSPFNLVAYSNIDYAGVSLDRKSTTGGCQFLGCRLISWQCKKQTVVANLSTEAKYVAAASCCAQVLWIQNQLLDYRIIVTAVRSKFFCLVNDVTRLQAPVDKKKVIFTEATIREALRLDDPKSIDCLPSEEIFTELSRMGYEKPSTKLTFYKAFFLPQWKFFIHTILQCMSAKRTSWNEFSSSMASAIICLSTGMIVAQHDDDVANEGAASVDVDDVPAAVDEPSIPLPTPTTQPLPPSQDLPSTSQDKIAQTLEITKLKKGGIIANIDANEDVTLKDVAAIAQDVADVENDAEIEENADDDEVEPAELQEVVEVVTAAKLMTKVVTATSATIAAADTSITAAIITVAPSAARRRK